MQYGVGRAEDPRELARQGCRLILSQCLGLQPGDKLALFYDEETRECAELLVEAATEQHVVILPRYVEVAEQIRLAGLERLPMDDLEALDHSRAVLLCFDARLEATPYRKRLVQCGSDRRLGTMPGVTLEVLAHAVNVDYDHALRRCGDLALAMLVGDRCRLTSCVLDAGGGIVREHVLAMRLGAWARSPITSPGVILDGTWGNLPGGETFIAPLENTANGTFVLNGAFSGCVLGPGEHILLHFVDGALRRIEGSGEPAEKLRRMLSLGLPAGLQLGLAELGVGVNPGVGELRGNALFDEKKEGTVHVAVGDNTQYGGKLTAPIHEDFITCQPSLTIDGKPVLTHGNWSLKPGDWREDFEQTMDLGRRPVEGFLVQRCYGLEAHEDRDGMLQVRRHVGSKRMCLYRVGDERVSRDLARLFRMLPDDETFYDLFREECTAQLGPMDEGYLRGLLTVLERHQLAAVKFRETDMD